MMTNLATLKIAVMVNALLLLLVGFVGFFTINQSTSNQSTSQAVGAVATSPTPTNVVLTGSPVANDPLAGLPYVSAEGLKQSYLINISTAQPMVQARSSR